MTPITFAHRGAPDDLPENSLPAFERALALGASGVESDVYLTADSIPVLYHRPVLRGRIPVSRLARHDLPLTIPSLADLYRHCGSDFELSLDMPQPQAAEAVVEIAAEYGGLEHLWLTYWNVPTLAEWRERWPRVHLVYPTIPLRHPERLMARLHTAGINAVNLYHRLCSRRLVDLAHTHDLACFAWGVRRPRSAARVVRLEIDGLYGDDVAAMVAAMSVAS